MFGRADTQQPEPSEQPAAAPEPTTVADPTSTTNNQSWQHPGAPITDAAAPSTATPSFNPVTPAVSPTDTSAPSADANALLDIKQDALNKLSPLVDQLDQSPEEKFRTTMMMIQASDNQALVKSAYDAAQAIPDEKARAQALLDVINEINYFTQHKDS